MSDLRFDWHPAKAASNLRKHGVSFEEAKSVFADPNVLIKPDLDHSLIEDRAHAIGCSERGRLLFVVVVDMHDEEIIRIISARRPTKRETQAYIEAAA